MKRKITVGLLMMFLALNFVFSASVDREKAIKVAQNYLAERYAARGLEVPLAFEIKSTDIIYNSTGDYAIMYVVNLIPQGFVLISADDRVLPVLGYSHQNFMDINNMAPSNKYWLGGYEMQIEYAIKNDLEADHKTIMDWERLSVDNFVVQTPKSIAVVGPLMDFPWDQGRYYNRLCPEDPEAPSGYDGRVPNGCVALATSMVMYYHRHPEMGTGSHSYNSSGYGVQMANYGATTYDWSAMTDKLTSYNTNVARLIYHLGVAVDMDYAADGSGSQTEYAGNALKNYFKYSSTLTTKSRWSHTSPTWISLLKENLDIDHPMIYSGSEQSGSGHAFNCDGYDDANYFHFNWGWGGYGNGYYNISELNPVGNNFNFYQKVIVNIIPNNPANSCPSLKTLTASSGSISDGSGSIKYGHNLDCRWLIAPENASSIVISFSRFKTQLNYDIVTIYDGESTSDPVVGTYSGTTIPADITINGPKALVRFQTNNAIADQGFLLNYKANNQTAFCSSTKIITTPTGTISDGSEEEKYNNNSYCRWFIQPAGATSMTLTFNNFDVSPEDEVLIYNRAVSPIQLIAKYSGANLPPTTVIPSGKLAVEFLSDNFNVGQGWDATWTSTNSATGIQNMDGINQMSIFPNPANNELNIQIASEFLINANLSITDLTGKKLLNENISVSEMLNFKLDVSNYSKGMYFVILKNETGTMILKFIKQ